ncbi:MAG: NAD(+) synthase [Methylocystaceae bacterium]
MNSAALAEQMIKWMQERIQAAGAKGLVVGLSGGIDSAVVAALAQRAVGSAVAGIMMPCHSIREDLEHAYLLARHLNMEHHEVDLTPAYDSLIAQMTGLQLTGEREQLARANIKPRLRMTTLYYFAQSRGYLVAGTGNKSELTVGYFTKYGDAGVDILPLADLVKTEVRELAAYLQIPPVIIEKHPSAGLWQGQTDEKEMGFTYEQLDNYILTGKADPAIKTKIQKMEQVSEHKRQPVPAFRRVER